MRRRLEFFVGDAPVGHFRTRGYPTQSGRYRYAPYRGAGHAVLARTLRSGEPVDCWFSRRGKKMGFRVDREENVEGRRFEWFVTISGLHPCSKTG